MWEVNGGAPRAIQVDPPARRPETSGVRASATAAGSPEIVSRRVGWLRSRSGRVLAALLVVETLLLLVAQIPVAAWPHLRLPDGPIPPALLPVAAGCFYLIPTISGALCRRWYAALAFASLPAWIALGAFAVASSPSLGFAYLAEDAHASGGAGTLELFAGLGLLGWLLRLVARDALRRREGGIE